MKRLTAFVLLLLIVFSLAACGQGNSPDTGDNPVTPQHGGLKPGNSIPQEEDSPATVLTGDSYWVLYESEGDEREYVPESDDLLTDLTLWADGTARIRDIQNDIWLVSDVDEQSMTWKQEEDGTLHLYTAYSGEEPYWSGVVTEEGIELSRFGGTFRFRQEPMPEGGALYSPAELQGVWLQTGSEVEGYTEQSMPGRFGSLVIQPDWNGDEQVLLASSEQGSFSDYRAYGTYYDQMITVLDEPVYEGCGNDVWSARIGEEVPKNENGFPEAGTTEFYVTLLDQNTLLQQQYFSIDGGPAVAYQTYRRILPEVDWGLEYSNLEGGDFELACFTTEDGSRQDTPPGISDFYLHLDVGGAQFFTVTFDDGSEYSGGGHWTLGEGGTLLLFNEEKFDEWPFDKQIDSEWFAGAAQSFNRIPEVYLWLEGGVMRLDHVEGSGGENYGGEGSGGEWEGYVDTMIDLEGNAFAAPGNAALVFYGDGYFEWLGQDIEWYHENEDVSLYAMADGPDVRQILLSCVNDNTPVWIEEDGVVIAQLGTMMAGESIIVRLGYPESGGFHLCFEYGGIEYYIELSQSSLALDAWEYITVE